MKGKLIVFSLITIFLILCFSQLVFAADDFPYRKDFSDVKVIETEELNNEYNDVIIVDVRSKFEFDVVHILSAKHVPISQASFSKDLEALRGKSDSKKLVFYCNGHTCKKSYHAVQKAAESGFENIYAYDSGIFDWISAYPDKGVLLDETPVDKSKIIPKSDLKARLLELADFKAKCEGENAVVIDIREPFQRENIPDIKNIKNIPLDRLLALLNKGEFKDKELCIFDAVAKQVDWLQYHLNAKGYTNYHFLKGGAGDK